MNKKRINRIRPKYNENTGKWCANVRYLNERGQHDRKRVYGRSESECMKNVEDLQSGIFHNEVRLNVENAFKGFIFDNEGSLKETTLTIYRTTLKRVVRSGLGTTNINSLTKQTLQRFIKVLEHDGCSVGTIRLTLKQLYAVCHYYDVKNLPEIHRELHIRQMPVKNLDLPTSAEIIDAVAGTDLEIACALSLCCGGMRRGEVLGLKYSDIFEGRDGKRRVHICRTMTGDGIHNTPKTPDSDRTVLLPDWLYERIEETRKYNDSEYIVPIEYCYFGRKFKNAMEKKRYYITFHCLRKIFVTDCMRAGVRPAEFTAAGGWAKGSVIPLTIYNQIAQQDIDRTSELLEEYRAGLSETKKIK